jgi:hypothetical protein
MRASWVRGSSAQAEPPSVARLAAWQQSELRVAIPGDAEWPTQLDDLDLTVEASLSG